MSRKIVDDNMWVYCISFALWLCKGKKNWWKVAWNGKRKKYKKKNVNEKERWEVNKRVRSLVRKKQKFIFRRLWMRSVFKYRRVCSMKTQEQQYIIWLHVSICIMFAFGRRIWINYLNDIHYMFEYIIRSKNDLFIL